MNTKKVIAAIVLSLFTVPAFASAYTYSASDYRGTTETLVEGHTVFALIQATLCIENLGDKGTDANGDPYDDEKSVRCPNVNASDFDLSYDVRANVTVQRLGTAVAVLVRDRVKEYVAPDVAVNCLTNRDVVTTILYENPGVLWFNDQFLVGDDLDIIETDVDANVDVCNKQANVVFDPANLEWRYPCGGWIFATQSGNPDPRGNLGQFNYEESYQIIDPNDHAWTIDKYGVLPAPIGTEVPFQDTTEDLGLDDDNGPGSAFDEDDDADGDARAVVGGFKDANGGIGGSASSYGYYLGAFNLWSVPVMMRNIVDEGPTSGCTFAPHTDASLNSGTAGLYNGVLFFFFEDLAVDQRGLNIAGLKVHGNGGADSGDTNGCQAEPANDGFETDPYDTCPGNNDNREGNSHAFNGGVPTPGNQGAMHVHPTASVDLYFSNVAPPTPAQRKFAIWDTVGSGAPMHSHVGTEPFDDRVRFSVCGDADSHRYENDKVFNGDGTYTGTEEYSEEEVVRFGEGEQFPTDDGVNGDDCTGGYDGGTTGWDPSGAGEDGSTVPTDEEY